MKQIYILRNEAIRNNAIDAILSLPIDDKSPHEVHVREPKRSKAQNDRMWPIKQQDVVPNLAGNGFVVIGQSTSRMRVSEFAELLELIQAFGTEHGVKWSDEARLALEWKARWGDRAA